MTAGRSTLRDVLLMPRWSQRRLGTVLVTALSVLQALAIIADVSEPLQPSLSLAFIALCPGALLLDLDEPSSVADRAMLALGASMAVNVVVITLATVGWVAVVVVAAVLLPIGWFRWPRQDPR